MKRLMSALTATILAVGLTGCLDTARVLPTGEGENQTAEKSLSPEELELLKQNFPYDIDPEKHHFDKDGGPIFKVSENIEFGKLDSRNEPFAEAFIDKELTMKVATDLDFIERGTFMLRPQIGKKIYDFVSSNKNRRDNERQLYAHENWESIDRIYVLQYKDSETGRPLERPKLSIHLLNKTADSYLESPQANMKINDEGVAELKWNEVPGADEYLVLKVSVIVGELENNDIDASLLTRTKNTSWKTDEGDEKERRKVLYALADNVIRVEDEAYDPSPNYEQLNSKSKEKAFIAVIAVNGNKQSGLSNRLSMEQLNNRMALRLAHNTIAQAMKHSAEHHLKFDSLEDLPTHFPFTMLNGVTKFFPLLPNVAETKETSKGLKVKVTSPAAGYSGELTVETYPQDWKGILEARAKELKDSKGGVADSPEFSAIIDKSKVINVVADEAADLNNLQPGETPYGEKIFASNPLSYRIAQGLIFNHTVIDISGIPGAEDEQLVYDAFQEAYTQTSSDSLVTFMDQYPNNKLKIVYRNTNAEERTENTKKARERLRQVVKELQLENLSPIEKTRKINRWVIENTEYNYDALKKYDEKIASIDSETEAAWTITGTAIHKKAVCQGYAKAFVFLAREAGLEAITVTGTINGSNDDGHMWVAVKIDGQWRHFDPTWNDSPGNEEVYFNLKADDPVLTKTHTLDHDYILDSLVNQYK